MSLDQSAIGNSLLARLPTDAFAALQPHLERIALENRHVLVKVDIAIEHIYFPEGGVASIVANQAEGATEVGIFGREGMSGTAVLLGSEQSPYGSYMQVNAPSALRVTVNDLRNACHESAALQTALLRYVQTFSIQVTQTAATNAQFGVAERLARWLLMCHDRIDGDDIALTHEFMSMMLGVRRAGVTEMLHILEGVLAIRAKRNLVTVINRKRLEDLAGLGYGRAEAEYRRLIGPFGKSTLTSGSEANIPRVTQ